MCSSAPSEADLEDLDQMAASFIKKESLKDALGDSQTPGSNAKGVTLSNGVKVKGEESRDPDVEQLERQELDQLLMPPPCQEGLGPRPTAASLGLTESIEECMKVTKSEGKDDNLQVAIGQRGSSMTNISRITSH